MSASAAMPVRIARTIVLHARARITSKMPYAAPAATTCSTDSGCPAKITSTSPESSTPVLPSRTSRRVPKSTSGNSAHARPSGQPT